MNHQKINEEKALKEQEEKELIQRQIDQQAWQERRQRIFQDAREADEKRKNETPNSEDVTMITICRTDNKFFVMAQGKMTGQPVSYIVRRAAAPGQCFPVAIEGQYAALEKAWNTYRQLVNQGHTIPV
jgi:hypothetical protein